MTTEAAMGLAGTGVREAYLEQDIREGLSKAIWTWKAI